MVAATHGRVDVVNRLLQYDEIDVNHAKATGMTALHLAIINQNVDVVEALLSIPRKH